MNLIPSPPIEHNVKKIINLMLQMSFAVLLFCIFFTLSVNSKPLDDLTSCGYQSCPSIDSEALNVHLIPHSHDDVGWLKTLDQYYFQDVQNVISSVIVALSQNPDRRFVQVETAYFKKWWEQQKESIKLNVMKLVNNGQFEIINGAWSMNDEAAVHYQSTIDQFTLGLRYLEDNLGKCGRPRVGWQIDPFGHSREQASISAHMGFDGMFFARLDYRDKQNRLDGRTMDLLWRGSTNLGNSSDIFTSVLYHHYSAPPGFCFDIVCNDEPIIDDEECPDYNYEERIVDFADFVRQQAQYFPTNNILITMGDDFRYEAAMNTYINLDRLIKGFDLFKQTYDGKPIKVFYSTPSCYTKAVNDYVLANNVSLEMKSDDFFPYADGIYTYWTGYFTSRPASKRFERLSNNFLQVVKQLAAVGQESYYNKNINALKEAVGVMQHHDAITGTEKQHVAHNYHLLLTSAMVKANEAAGEILSRIISGGGENLGFNSCLLANVSSCIQTKSDRFTVVIYNPLSRPITSSISLPIYSSTKWQILDVDNSELDYQIVPSITNFSYVENVETSAQTLQFTAKQVPSLGFKVYRFTNLNTKEIDEKSTSTTTFGYEDTNFTIDPDTGLLKTVTMKGISLNISQDFQYYTSTDSSGAYIFEPDSDESKRIAESPIKITPISGNISQGILQEFGTWAKQFIQVYNDDRNYIEFDWIIGPIDISDGRGKEIITKFTTALDTNETFYTDSNGRELLKRIRNFRPDYEYTNDEPVSGNYYPINSKILIRDEEQNLEVAILTDRSQGGTSLRDGEIEIMIHRACQSDDRRGVGENLNEQEFGQGIVVRGKHYLTLGPISDLPAIEKDIAQRKLLAPWMFITNNDISDSLSTLTFSALTRDLEYNAQILTLEPWSEDVLLLRLEHVFEIDEDEDLSKEIIVDVSDLFTNFKIMELQETTLDGNRFLSEIERLHWPGSSQTDKYHVKPVGSDLKITLAPMQIRTFLAKIAYN